MKTLQSRLSVNNGKFVRRMARNGFVAAAALVGSVQVFAADIAIDTAGISSQISAGATSAGQIAGYVALALAVLATAGVIFSMLRKA